MLPPTARLEVFTERASSWRVIEGGRARPAFEMELPLR
jgi:hypothetical protein